MAIDSLAQKARDILRHAHWITLVCLALFVGSFFFIVSPIGYLCAAGFVGFLTFVTMVSVWRKRSKHAFWILWSVMFFGEKVSELFGNQDIATPLSFWFVRFLQWMTLVILISSCFLVLFRIQITRFCRLSDFRQVGMD